LIVFDQPHQRSCWFYRYDTGDLQGPGRRVIWAVRRRRARRRRAHRDPPTPQSGEAIKISVRRDSGRPVLSLAFDEARPAFRHFYQPQRHPQLPP
jgi:hypothetical protein